MNVMKRTLAASKLSTRTLKIVTAIICIGLAGYFTFVARTSSSNINKSALKAPNPAKSSDVAQPSLLPVSSTPDQSSNASSGLQGQPVQTQQTMPSTNPSSSGQPTAGGTVQTPACSDTTCTTVSSPPSAPPTITPTPVTNQPHCEPCGIHSGSAASAAYVCPMYCVE